MKDEEATRRLTFKPFFIAVGVALVVAGFASTHFAASKLDVSASPCHITSNVYCPWGWLFWRPRLPVGAKYQALQNKIDNVALFSFMAVLGLFLMRRLILKPKSHKGLYGTAKFAALQTIKDAGLLTGLGVTLGAWRQGKDSKRYLLTHNGPEHVIGIAPTRSGKGVGMVIPTMLSWPHSAIIYDPKGEIFALTSGWRHAYGYNHVYKLDLTAEGGSCRYNPLAEVRLDSKSDVSDAKKIASMLVDPEGKGLNDHWQRTSHSLLTGLILFCLYDNRGAALKDVQRILQNPAKPIDEVIEEMRTYEGHSAVAEVGAAMSATEARERSSIISSASSYLQPFADPIIAENTSRSNFTISDLMNNDHPVSLYLVVNTAHATEIRPVIRLIMSQIIARLMEKMEYTTGRAQGAYKHKLLLMLDEFPTLRKIDQLAAALPVCAGYGIKFFMIIQDLDQLKEAYGQYETIMANAHIRIAYAPNNQRTAEEISKMTGISTVIKKSVGLSGGRFGQMRSANVSESEVQRNLLTADEVSRLKGNVFAASGKLISAGQVLVFVAGQDPILGEQAPFFIDKVLLERSKMKMSEAVAVHAG